MKSKGSTYGETRSQVPTTTTTTISPVVAAASVHFSMNKGMFNSENERNKVQPNEMVNKLLSLRSVSGKVPHRTASSSSERHLKQLHPRQSSSSLSSPPPMTGSSDSSNSTTPLTAIKCNETSSQDVTSSSICGWCQKQGIRLFTLRTPEGSKVFCSELCFTQCRRASFKKTKVCNWCKHVRHTVNYVEYFDGKNRLQFCSDKCLDQYKINIVNGEINRIPVALLQSLQAATAYANSLPVASSLSSPSSSSSASSSPSSSSSRVVNDAIEKTCTPTSAVISSILSPVSKYHTSSIQSSSSITSNTHLPVDLCVKGKSLTHKHNRSSDGSLVNTTTRTDRRIDRVIDAINHQHHHHERRSNLAKLLPEMRECTIQSYHSHYNRLNGDPLSSYCLDLSRVEGKLKRSFNTSNLYSSESINNFHPVRVKKSKRTINGEKVIAPSNTIHTVRCNEDDHHYNGRDEKSSMAGVKKISSSFMSKLNGNHLANSLIDETLSEEALKLVRSVPLDARRLLNGGRQHYHHRIRSEASEGMRVPSSHSSFSPLEPSQSGQFARSGEEGDADEGEDEGDYGEEEQQQEEEEREGEEEVARVREAGKGRKELGGEVKEEMRGGERSLETHWPARNAKAESTGVQSFYRCKKRDEEDEEEEEEEEAEGEGEGEENCEKKKKTDHSNNGNNNDSGAHSGEKKHQQSKSHHSHSLGKHEEGEENACKSDRHSHASEVTDNVTCKSSSKRTVDQVSNTSLGRFVSSSTSLLDLPSPSSSVIGSEVDTSLHSNASGGVKVDTGSVNCSTAWPSGHSAFVLPVPLMLPVPFPVPIPIFLLRPDLICQINRIASQLTSEKSVQLRHTDGASEEDTKSSETK